MKTKLNMIIVLTLLAALVAIPGAQALSTGPVLLEQLPNQISTTSADDANCAYGTCSAAENFTVPADETLTIAQIQLWGVYTGDPSAYTDSFTVVFYQPDGVYGSYPFIQTGLPGTAIYTENSVIATREATGMIIDLGYLTYSEYLITLTLAELQTFAAGTYWIEVQNHSTGGGYFRWELSSNFDIALGLNDIAAYCNPATYAYCSHTWQFDLTRNLALRLLGPATTSTYSISGTVFNDADGDGIWDLDETGLANSVVHVDSGCDGAIDSQEPVNPDGSYLLSSVPSDLCISVEATHGTANTYLGWKETTPAVRFDPLTADQTGMNIGLQEYMLSYSPVDFDLPAGQVGQFYNQTITVIGGVLPYTFTPGGEGNLPANGLYITTDATTGVITISGTPAVASKYYLDLKVTDANGVFGSVERSFIIKTDGVFTFTSSSNPSAPGEAVTFTLSATGEAVHPDFGPVPPIGTVAFFVDETPIEGCSDLVLNVLLNEYGYADPTTIGDRPVTCTAAALTEGTHQITASYTGIELYNTPTLALAQQVAPATHSISGSVFDDQNTNGAYDTSEPGLSGVEVILDKSCDGTDWVTTTTDSAGSYIFTGQEAGQRYCVWAFPPDGYKWTLFPSVIDSLAADVTGMNFGFTNLPLFSWTPTNPLEGGGSATFTAASGFTGYYWLITDPGVACSSADWISPPSGQTANLDFWVQSGTYQVCLLMYNTDGYPIYDGQLVTVANVAPAPVEGGISPEPSIAGQPILEAYAAFADWDQLVTCTIDYGDGTAAETGTIYPEESTCAGFGNTYAQPGTYHVTFTVTDTDGAQGVWSGDHVVTAPPNSADLSIDKADSKDPVKPGSKMTYTLVVSNLGPNTAENITVTDKLDGNTTYDSVSAPKGWTCQYAANSATVTCTGASLASGSSAIIKITVTVNKTAPIDKELVNTAQVTSATFDTILLNNSVTQKTLVVAK